MDDDSDDKDGSKRRTRNLSEKKRRDNFNMLVNELCTMVSTSSRKMDKTSVLKSTISFLKNHNEVTVKAKAHDVQEDWKPAFLSNEEFTYLVLEALEGFVMVFSTGGQIYYVSESITSLLGHNPVDLMDKSIFDLVFEDDRTNLYNLLQNPETTIDPMQPFARENEIRFQCHLRRSTLDFRDEITYDLIEFNGHFRTNMDHNDSGGRYQQEYGSRLLFVCTGRLCTPQLIRDVSLADITRNEFSSRHSLEWKFLFLDHRASPIIGYLPFEVLGTSGYDYYHFDDLEKVVKCHEALMQKGELTSCHYRFLTKGQQWIWLQSRFYITYHQWNSKPEFVVCTHRVVSYADVIKRKNQEEAEAAAAEAAKKAESKRVVNGSFRPEETITSVSPSYISESGDNFGAFQTLSQPASAKSPSAGSTSGTVASVGTATATVISWPATSRVPYPAGSDTASVSGESRSSQRNGSLEAPNGTEPPLAPQHGIGGQYIEPASYVGTVGSRVLPVAMSPIPVIVSTDQAQLQRQLQRKHEELQQMIVRQQEELRRVKEQLLLARLGIMQPVVHISHPYSDSEDIQSIPTQMVYHGNQVSAVPGYVVPQTSLQPPVQQPVQPPVQPPPQPLVQPQVQPPLHPPVHPPLHQPLQPPVHPPLLPPEQPPVRPPGQSPLQPLLCPPIQPPPQLTTSGHHQHLP